MPASPTLRLGNGVEILLHFSGEAAHEIWGVKRGLGVMLEGVDVAGEGMGIGGVVALSRGDTYFALDSEDEQGDGYIGRRLLLDGVSRKHIGQARIDPLYNPIKAALSRVYLSSRPFRPLYTFLMHTRTILISSVLERREPIGHVELRYKVSGDALHVWARWSLKGRVILANELKGRFFDELIVDGSRVELSPWMEIRCEEAELRSKRLRLSMIVNGIDEATIFCGREVVGRRLDWAGFSYIPHEGVEELDYTVRLMRHG